MAPLEALNDSLRLKIPRLKARGSCFNEQCVGSEIASVLIGDHSTLLAPFNYPKIPPSESVGFSP